jgi:hypothetical protein
VNVRTFRELQKMKEVLNDIQIRIDRIERSIGSR